MDERELQIVMWLVLEEKEAEETVNACTRGRVHFRHSIVIAFIRQ